MCSLLFFPKIKITRNRKALEVSIGVEPHENLHPTSFETLLLVVIRRNIGIRYSHKLQFQDNFVFMLSN